MMRLAVSNIAWSFDNRLAAYAILRDHGLDGLEIAPSLLFAGADDPFLPPAAVVAARLGEIAGAGLRLVSMQSLLFGVGDAALFGPPAAADRLVRGLERAIVLAGRLGIPNLVFGSPRQRVVPPELSPDAALQHACGVFRRLGDLAAANGTRLALEPNPAGYGTNFMTTFAETLAVVHAAGHPAVTLNFDLGALHMTGAAGDAAAFIAAAGPHLSHVHLSAPFLAPAPQTTEEAAAVLRALAGTGYAGAVSVEMKAVAGDELAGVAVAAERLRAAAEVTGVA